MSVVDDFRIRVGIDNEAEAEAAYARLNAAQAKLRTHMQQEVALLKQAKFSAAEAAAGLTKLASAEDLASGATARVGGGLRGVSDESKKMGRGLGEGVNMVTEMAYGFSGLSPKIREVTVGLAGAGNNAFIMGASMGPLGVGLALVIGLLPSLIQLLTDSGDEAITTAESFDVTTESIQTMIDKLREADAAASLSQRRQMGLLTADEARAQAGITGREVQSRARQFSAQLERMGISTTDRRYGQLMAMAQRGEDFTQRLRGTEIRSDNYDDARTAAAGLAAASERNAQAIQDAADAQRDLNEGLAEEEQFRLDSSDYDRRHRRRGRRQDLDSNANPIFERFDMNAEMAYANADTAKEGAAITGAAQANNANVRRREQEAQRSRDKELQAQRAQIAAQNALVRESEDASRAFSDSWKNGIDSVIEAWYELERVSAKSGRAMASTSQLIGKSMEATGKQISEVVGNDFRGAFEDAIGAMLDGTKTFDQAMADMAKSAIRSLVQQSIVQVAVEGAQAIAHAAVYDEAGAAAHLAAMAAWGAVGAVAGGVGAGIGAFGGGGASKANVPSSSSALDNGGLVSDRSSQGAAALTIVLNAPNALMTRGEQGVFVQTLIDAARRENLIPRNTPQVGR